LADLTESLVRNHDYERYLAALFAPEAVRTDLFAIYAFNFEIAKIAESVRNPAAGQIRFQWWRDAIDEIYSGARSRTEGMNRLAAAIARHQLPKGLLISILDSRELDLEPEPFPDFSALEFYADATSGNVMKLAARVLGAGETVDSGASDAGI